VGFPVEIILFEPNAAELPTELNTVVPKPVHCVPLLEYANVLVPWPAATKIVPVQTIPFPLVLNIVTPNPVQDEGNFELV